MVVVETEDFQGESSSRRLQVAQRRAVDQRDCDVTTRSQATSPTDAQPRTPAAGANVVTNLTPVTGGSDDVRLPPIANLQFIYAMLADLERQLRVNHDGNSASDTHFQYSIGILDNLITF